MDQPLNPSSRPRRGVLTVLGAGVATALVGGAIVLGGSSAVEASGLSTFTSCAELRDWGADAMRAQRGEENFEEIGMAIEDSGGGADAAASGAPMTTTAVAAEAEGSADMAFTDDDGAGGGGDATNVIVEGIDEPDLVERLGGDRALVVGGQTLAVVDLAAASIEASARVSWGAQVTYDAEAGIAWSVGSGDGGQVFVQRFVVAQGTLAEDGSWSTPGQLVSVRRQGGELVVVATDGFDHPVGFEEIAPDPAVGGDSDVVDGSGGSGGSGADPVAPADDIPFPGGPVPCDQVLHPQGPAEPTSTLLVVLPVSGSLEPVRSTQVVGSGSNVHVTADAAYLATPSWNADDGSQTTGLHRFDLGSLTHTGSGAVEGSLLNDFSLSEHDGHLRVAVTIGGGFVGIGMPMPIEDGPGGDISGDVGEPIPSEPVLDGPAESPMIEDGAAATDAAAATSTSVPEPAPQSETTVSREVPEGFAPETAPDTTVPETTVADPDEPVGTIVAETIVEEPMPVDPFPMPTVVEPAPGGDAINEIVVLDTDGDLDVVGRTPRFGHPGETLHGIRFEGDVAYAVTFLQTDPFYVVDLADPADPRILGELQLPGFSSYLHPISATEVVGFGPDEAGRASAKLFDVSDRANPRVVDSIVLGDDSPVSWDHHAFVSLGSGRFAVPANQWSQGSYIEPACDICPGGQLVGVENHVVVLAVSGGRLVEEERISVNLPESIVRVIPAVDGWGLLSSTQLAVVDSAGTVRGTVPLD